MKLLLRIIINSLAVLLAANIVTGIHVDSFWTAVLVAIVLGILNATLGVFLKVLTFPLTIVTFGIFLLVINGLVFWAASFIKGFSVDGFGPAFLGALIVTVVSIVGRKLLESKN